MMIRLLPLLLLSGCAHNFANCDTARTAAMLATEAVARICTVRVEPASPISPWPR